MFHITKKSPDYNNLIDSYLLLKIKRLPITDFNSLCSRTIDKMRCFNNILNIEYNRNDIRNSLKRLKRAGFIYYEKIVYGWSISTFQKESVDEKIKDLMSFVEELKKSEPHYGRSILIEVIDERKGSQKMNLKRKGHSCEHRKFRRGDLVLFDDRRYVVLNDEDEDGILTIGLSDSDENCEKIHFSLVKLNEPIEKLLEEGLFQIGEDKDGVFIYQRFLGQDFYSKSIDKIFHNEALFKKICKACEDANTEFRKNFGIIS